MPSRKMEHAHFNHFLVSLVLFVMIKVLAAQSSGSSGIEVRLAGGPNPYEGRVEVRRGGRGTWGTLCYYGWDRRKTDVVCRHLGLGYGRVIETQVMLKNHPFYMDDLTCSGSEPRLDSCYFTSWDAPFCLNAKLACVHCQPLRCSGVEDHGEFCSPSQSKEFEVYLVDGPSAREGRLEVRQSGGDWVTVCDDFFGAKAATVVCRQLRVGTFGKLVSSAALGMGSKVMFLDDMDCNGTESNLGQCGHVGWGNHDCDRGEVVAVKCQGEVNSDIEVRLVDGPNEKVGRLEVRRDGSDWGTVCDDDFDNSDATVVCRQLNLSVTGIVSTGAPYGTGSGTMHLDRVGCVGTELRLAFCTLSGWGQHNCSPNEAVGVECDVNSEIEVRLVDGPNEKVGRLEIRRNGSDWGTVCRTGFDNKDVTVVCRQLNLSLIGLAPLGLYGTGSGTMHLDDVDCAGTELNLGFCIHGGWGINNCSSNDAVGIACYGTSVEPTIQTSAAFPDWASVEPTIHTSAAFPDWTSVEPTIQTSAAFPDWASVEPTIQTSAAFPDWASVEPTIQTSAAFPDWTSVEPTIQTSAAFPDSTETPKPLEESNKTDTLRILRKSEVVTAKTVSQTRNVIEEKGKTSAADVVEVAEILHRASQLQNISKETANDLLEIVDSLAELNQSVLEQSNSNGNTTNRLIMAVEQLGDKVSLEGGKVRLETNSTVLQVWSLTTQASDNSSSSSSADFFGLQLTSDGNTEKVVPGGNQSNTDAYANIDAAIALHANIGRLIVANSSGKDVRLSASVIKQTRLFRAGVQRTDEAMGLTTERDRGHRGGGGREEVEEGVGILNSKVISMRITVDGRSVTNLSAYRQGGQGDVTTIFKPLKKTPRAAKELPSDDRDGVQCVFWDLTLHENKGGWSSKGCSLKAVVSGTIICVCDHLTSFAILMDLEGQGGNRSRLHHNILSLITTVGLTISICGLSLTLIAFILVKKLHRSLPQQTLFNTALALLLAWVTFLTGIGRVDSHVTCVAVAMLLHYLILASFLWTLAQGVLQYFMLVKAQQRPFSRYMLKAGLSAWGLPALPVIIVSVIDVNLYRGEKSFCWMSLGAFRYAFLVPVVVIVAINIVIYVMVVVSICRRPNISSTSGTSYTAISVRASISCFVVLGLSWTFAFFTLGEARLVFQYLFTCTTALQGFLIFTLYTARDPAVRAFFVAKLRRRESSTGTTTPLNKPAKPSMSSRRRGVGAGVGAANTAGSSTSTKETSFSSLPTSKP